MVNEDLAKKAYLAFKETQEKFHNPPLLAWENLPVDIQESWRNAASALAQPAAGIANGASLNLHKLAIPRGCWEVVAGVIPGLPQRELTKRFVLNQAEWESEESAKIFVERMNEAYEYARSLNSPAQFNWVDVSWIWY